MPALKIWNGIDHTWEYVRNSLYHYTASYKSASLAMQVAYSPIIENIADTASLAYTSSYAYSGSANFVGVSIVKNIDGGGDTLDVGSQGYLEVPFNMIITGWTIVSDEVGDAIVLVRKCTYSSFPPTGADTITGFDPPTLTSTNKNQNLNIQFWTTTRVNAGDVLEFYLSYVSSTTITKIMVALRGYKT